MTSLSLKVEPLFHHLPGVEIFWNWSLWFGPDFHLTRDLDFHLSYIQKNYLVLWKICRRSIPEYSGLDFQFLGLRLLEVKVKRSVRDVKDVMVIMLKGVKDMVVT